MNLPPPFIALLHCSALIFGAFCQNETHVDGHGLDNNQSGGGNQHVGDQAEVIYSTIAFNKRQNTWDNSKYFHFQIMIPVDPCVHPMCRLQDAADEDGSRRRKRDLQRGVQVKHASLKMACLEQQSIFAQLTQMFWRFIYFRGCTKMLYLAFFFGKVILCVQSIKVDLCSTLNTLTYRNGTFCLSSVFISCVFQYVFREFAGAHPNAAKWVIPLKTVGAV